MIYLIAILLPWLGLLMRGHIVQGLLCLILQLTVLGWPIAAIWALFVIRNDDDERRMRMIIESGRVPPPRRHRPF